MTRRTDRTQTCTKSDAKTRLSQAKMYLQMAEMSYSKAFPVAENQRVDDRQGGDQKGAEYA
jgi:hypothetical protein